MPEYIAKALIEVRIEAMNEIIAESKFDADMRGTFNGVRKVTLVRPNFEPDTGTERGNEEA